MNGVINSLYIVASPIGNLNDLTDRAKHVLSEVEIVFCEDTRVTAKILNHLQIKKKLVSCNAHNEQSKAAKLLEFLKDGKSVAFLSDAGTPGISDPGNFLIEEVINAGFEVIPIPGPSAIATLLSASGINLAKNGFYFAGFLPRKDGKLKKLIDTFVLEYKIPVVAFESPYRIKKSLEKIAEVDPQIECCIGRELTKVYEEILRGTVEELASKKITEKGEFVIALYKKK